MKRLSQAIETADRHAADGRVYYVVYSPDEYDIPGNNYHVCDLDERLTFFAGCDIRYATDD